jgi:hypothetical protein
MRFRPTRSELVLVGFLALVPVVAGVAYATIPDGNGVYTVCMTKKTGQIRMIDR